MDLASAAAKSLPRRSSRRQFFKFLGAGALGTGILLSRTEATLGFTNQPMPCTPRRHSGDQPCPCPPIEAPIPNLVLQDG